ncbi:hypothetical protein ACH79_15645 [Bradyrhizobium sp. CCBAU 051011]|uniref:hypothetical protein n=1 Tax=Bradyrhizobium sp. CCBAU 051011 TaxID=858422 RepID=UPI001373A88E|nr:hypothetical protein [Bradyrhizobium sp. CCBAU 051011]QHO73871.1 hypothetical protein ACH79_15645 [Bradyrhizobium sp. CCBAU 051011]
MYKIDRERFLDLTENHDIPTVPQVEAILEEAESESLSYAKLNSLVNAIHSTEFQAIRDKVLAKSEFVRRKIYGGLVVSMAPVEVTNRCASDCNFCGWRSDNNEMRRLSLDERLIVVQVEYLLAKGFQHIELVGGDDVKFVRDQLPVLVQRVRQIMGGSLANRVLFCTMALTSRHYRSLKNAGADGIIMWQETYDHEVYNSHITKGPKARGIDDSYKVVKNGDGYRFRLESQDRALREGLSASVGAMLGLNPNIGFEIIATVDHARYLESSYQPADPIIVGMPTWNNITTPRTDKRPARTLPIDGYFAFFASIYFLALHRYRAWIFPNCRVSLPIQIDAVRAAGVYTSTEVKLGPGGYLNSAISKLPVEQRAAIMQMLKSTFKGELSAENWHDELDNLEQFKHDFHHHETYVKALTDAGLFIGSQTAPSSANH